MSDLVERLRAHAVMNPQIPSENASRARACKEAADEIERLRAGMGAVAFALGWTDLKGKSLEEFARDTRSQLEYARRTIRDIGEFCSGEDATLGAIKRLTHIQNTAQQFCAKTDEQGC